MDVSCHRHFFPVLILNQRWSPPLTLQASHCSTFRIMCDVPSIAVFCRESIECFPGTVSKFLFKLLVTIPVAPVITGTNVHFRFHIRCISIDKLLYFNFFSDSFCTTFLSVGITTSISVHVFSFLFLIIISGLFDVTSLSVCTAWFHNTVTSPSSHTGLGMCVYHLSVVSIPKTSIIIIIIIINWVYGCVLDLVFLIIELGYSNPITGLDRPRGFQEVEAPRFQNNRHMKVVRLSALRTGRL